MTRRRRTHRPSMTWQRVRAFVRCDYPATKDHSGEIVSGEMALFGPWRPGRPRLTICKACAKSNYNLEPTDAEMPKWKGPDGRAMQLPENDR